MLINLSSMNLIHLEAEYYFLRGMKEGIYSILFGDGEEGRGTFFRRGMRKGVSSIKGIQVLIMPHRISQQTNVVNNQLAKSNFFSLLFYWMLIMTTFILWAMLIMHKVS